jgi:hypothetical protein
MGKKREKVSSGWRKKERRKRVQMKVEGGEIVG